MTQEELFCTLDEYLEENLTAADKDVTAEFDFPLQGNPATFKVVSFKNGKLTLYNPYCSRPVGHE